MFWFVNNHLTHDLDLRFSNLNFEKVLRNGMADWYGTRGMWVDRMLDSHCDFELWHHPWPWPWIFKVIFLNLYLRNGRADQHAIHVTSSYPAPTGVDDEVLPAPHVSYASCQDVESTSVDWVSSVPCSQESDTDDGDVGYTLASIRMLESPMMFVTSHLYISMVRRSLPELDWTMGNLANKNIPGGGLSRDDIDDIYIYIYI